MLALQTIRTHKLRAFLTVLGVIIGTGTIIGVARHPHRLRRLHHRRCCAASGRTRSSFSNSRWDPAPRNLTPEERTRKNLTYQNAVDIRERCRAVEDVSPMLFPHRRWHQRPLQGQRHVRRQPVRRGRGVCPRRAGGYAPRPLLHRRGEPPAHARRRGRRRISKRACSPTWTPSAKRSTWTATNSR